eukprot:scaffold7680_cov220-Skeletonema_marinoi.AAC.1
MDALLSLGCSSSPSSLFKKKKKNKMGQSSYNSNISNNSSGSNSNVLQMKSDGFSLAIEWYIDVGRIQLDNQPSYGEEKKK